MAYANAAERRGLIGGLRALADFLEGSPEVPAPIWADVTVFPTGTDAEMRTEIEKTAAFIGAGIDDQSASLRHYTTSRFFGPVQYRAVAIPERARAYHDALRSYAGNIIVPGTDGGCDE